MKVLNPLKANDWEIGIFLKSIALFQILVIALTLLDYINLQILVFSQVVFIIYLTFVPGMLVLRAFKIHNLNCVENLCYCVGLSLAVVMFSGLFANIVYPFLEVSEPISRGPLVMTLTPLIIVLCSISYIRDKDFANPKILEFELSPSILFLCILPFLAIFGTYLVNYYDNHFLLLLSIIVAGLIPILVMFDIIKERLYPLAIFAISIFLLYHTSLISTHIWGWDIHLEYYFASTSLANGRWDPGLYGATNGMPAITILAPSYANLCNIDLVWVFKALYPLFFSFVPFAMYCVFRREVGEKTSFLACFLFMSVGVFYGMPYLAKQEIAELFLALIFLTCTTKNLRNIDKSLLFIFFGTSLVFSHYGTAYLFMLVLIAYHLALWLINHIQSLRSCFYRQNLLPNSRESTFRLSFIVMYVAITLSWYMHVAGSHPFETLLNSTKILFEEFVNPFQSDAFQLLIRGTASPLHDVTKYLHHITQFLTVVGILDLTIIQKNTEKIEVEHSLLSLIFFFMWIASAILPLYGFDFTRVYHLSLIMLSPLCIVGGLAFNEFLVLFSREKLKITSLQALKIISTFLFVFLLFNSGWVYEIAKDNPTSVSLSNIDYPCFDIQEVTGARWLHMSIVNGHIYADDYRRWLIAEFEGFPLTWYASYKSQSIVNLYVFLGVFNVKSGSVLESHEIGPRISLREYIELSEVLEGLSKIYDNGGSEIFFRTRQ